MNFKSPLWIQMIVESTEMLRNYKHFTTPNTECTWKFLARATPPASFLFFIHVLLPDRPVGNMSSHKSSHCRFGRRTSLNSFKGNQKLGKKLNVKAGCLHRKCLNSGALHQILGVAFLQHIPNLLPFRISRGENKIFSVYEF